MSGNCIRSMGKMVLKYFVIYCCNNKLPPNFASWNNIYWVGQKVHLGFAITSYGKSWTNFLANPIFNLPTHPMDQDFVSSLARWLWLPVSHEVIDQMLAGFAVICRSGWAEGATSSSVTWRLSGSLFSSPCRTPGMGEPGGLPSMGSHRVGHDWSDLAAAAGHHGGHLLLVPVIWETDRQTEPEKREKGHDGGHRTFLWPDLQSRALSLPVYSICQKWVTNSSPYSRGGRLTQAKSIRESVDISLKIHLTILSIIKCPKITINRTKRVLFIITWNSVLLKIIKKKEGLPWWLSGKEYACQSGDTSSIPELRRSLGGGNGSPFQ